MKMREKNKRKQENVIRLERTQGKAITTKQLLISNIMASSFWTLCEIIHRIPINNHRKNGENSIPIIFPSSLCLKKNGRETWYRRSNGQLVGLKENHAIAIFLLHVLTITYLCCFLTLKNNSLATVVTRPRQLLISTRLSSKRNCVSFHFESNHLFICSRTKTQLQCAYSRKTMCKLPVYHSNLSYLSDKKVNKFYYMSF